MSNTQLIQQGELWELRAKTLYEDAIVDAFEPVSQHVVVESFRPNPTREWSNLEVQLRADMRSLSLSVRDMRLDLRMQKSEFLDLMPMWRVGGLQAWFLSRPCPDTLRILDIPADRRHRVLTSLGFTLEFSWPLPAISDWASFTSSQEHVIRRLALAFADR